MLFLVDVYVLNKPPRDAERISFHKYIIHHHKNIRWIFGRVSLGSVATIIKQKPDCTVLEWALLSVFLSGYPCVSPGLFYSDPPHHTPALISVQQTQGEDQSVSSLDYWYNHWLGKSIVCRWRYEMCTVLQCRVAFCHVCCQLFCRTWESGVLQNHLWCYIFCGFFYCFRQSAVCLYLLWGEGVICHFYESRENSVNIYDVDIPFINFDRGCFNVWRSVRVALMCDIDMLTLQLHLKRRRTNHV